MTVHFDLETVRRDLKEIADNNPGYVYQTNEAGGCVYFTRDSKPSCIVGRMFAKRGVSPDLFKSYTLNTKKVRALARVTTGIVDFDEDALDYATEVQNCQDRGYSWSKAVERAEDKFLGEKS